MASPAPAEALTTRCPESLSHSRSRTGDVRRLRRQRGGALVEFAIVLPILLLLVFGLWEFGRIFDTWLVVTNAAREGARYASASSADTAGAIRGEIQPKVQSYLDAGYGPRLGLAGDVAIDLNNPAYFRVERAPSGGHITVTVRAAIDIYAPVVDALADSSGMFTVTARATMRQ